MAVTSTVDQVTPDLTSYGSLSSTSTYGASDSWVLIDAGLQGVQARSSTPRSASVKGTAPKQSSLLMVILITSVAFPNIRLECASLRAARTTSPDRSGRLPAARPDRGQGVLALMSFTYPNKAMI